MLTKLKSWLENLDQDDDLDKHDTKVQKIFAIVIFHVIKADGVESEKEKEQFSTYFEGQFELDEKAVTQLYEDVSVLEGDFDYHLKALQELIGNSPGIKVKLMHAINTLIQSDKIDDREYRVFDRIKDSLF